MVKSHCGWHTRNAIEVLDELHPGECLPKHILLLLHLILCLGHALKQRGWHLTLYHWLLGLVLLQLWHFSLRFDLVLERVGRLFLDS